MLKNESQIVFVKMVNKRSTTSQIDPKQFTTFLNFKVPEDSSWKYLRVLLCFVMFCLNLLDFLSANLLSSPWAEIPCVLVVTQAAHQLAFSTTDLKVENPPEGWHSGFQPMVTPYTPHKN